MLAHAYLLKFMPERVLPFLQEVEDACYGDAAIDATTVLTRYQSGDWAI